MNKYKREIIQSAVDSMKILRPDTVLRHYCFQPDFIGFSGHFPGYPILPAFVQLMTALTLAEEQKGCELKLDTVTNAKFHLEILPGHEIAVQCQDRTIKDKPGCEASITLDDKIATSILMTFKEDKSIDQ